MSTPPLSEAVCLIVEYALKHGVENIEDLGKAWFVQLDKRWAFAANATKSIQHTGPKDGMDIDLHPHHFAVWRNGWLFALLTPFAGTFMGEDGKGEDEFIARMKEELDSSGSSRR